MWSPSSEAEVAEALASATAAHEAVVVWGNRTKLDFGAPPRRVDVGLDCSGLPAVIEHAADDLVVRASASVPLATLQEALAAANQRLSLDEVVPGSTLGGLVGTGLAGPIRLRYGAARDLLLGVRFVLSDGTVAKAGSRVVKNVAGFDLPKLCCGSYGTLAVVTETIWRLHPRPQAAAVLTRRGDAADLALAAIALSRSPLACVAIELNQPREAEPELAVLLEGFEAALPERANRAGVLLGGSVTRSEEPPGWWGRLPSGVVLRVAFPPGQSGEVLRRVQLVAGDWVLRGSLALGSLLLGLGDVGPEDVRAAIEVLRPALGALGGTVVVLAGPAHAKVGVDLFGTVGGEAVMRRVKERFDPDGTLAPGRYLGDR